MRLLSTAAISASLILFAVTLGCDGDRKKDSAGGVPGEAPGSTASAIATSPPLAIDTSYILPDHFFAILIQPRRIVEAPLIAEQLKNPMIAEQVKQFSIAPQEIDQALVLGSWVETRPEVTEIMPTVVTHFTHAVDVKQIAPNLLMNTMAKKAGKVEETQLAGKMVFDLNTSFGMFAYSPDASTVVLAHKSVLEKLFQGSSANNPLAKRLQSASVDNEIVVAATPANMPRLDRMIAEAPVSPPFDRFMQALKLIDGATIGLNLQADSLARISIDAKDHSATSNIQDLLDEAVKMARGLVAAGMMSQPADVKPIIVPLLNLVDQALDNTKIAAQGNLVTAVMPRPANLETVVRVQLDALTKLSQMKVETAQAMLNLRQIGLACHYYELKSKTFPAAAISKDGKALLSWRVAILPYIGQEDLYQQFHLDEPWDSPSNTKLLDKMPEVYRIPGRPNGGKTSFMVIAGKDTVFDGDWAMRPSDIRDGTSRTILAVEAGPDKAVPWTKPQDLPFDSRNPAAALGVVPPNGFVALFCDGSVRVLPKTIDSETLKGLITPNGGEAVDPDKLNHR